MKNIITSAIIAFGFFAHTVSAADNPSFRVSDSDSSKGTLSMRVLDLEGDTSVENVNIEFDFRNSTFRVLDNRPANAPSSAEPEKVNTTGDLSVELQRCVNTNRVVTCHLIITNTEFDDEVNFCADSGNSFCGPNSRSTATDNFGNLYTASKVSIAAETSPARISAFFLPVDTPTEATIEFKNVSSQATSFSSVQLMFGKYTAAERLIDPIPLNFNNITFQ